MPEPAVLRPKSLRSKLDLLLPLGALGFAGYQALTTVYWSGFIIFMGPVVIYGVVGLWNLLLRCVRLSPARLDYFNGYWWRGMNRADIKGYRTRPAQSIVWYYLVPKEPDAKTVNIPEWVFQHPDAKYWFDGFVDLAPIEKVEAQAALENDPAMGADKPARKHSVLILKVWAITLSVVAFGLLCAAILTNFCDRLVLGALGAMPLVCLLLDLAYPDRFRFFYEREGRDARPTLAVAFALPAAFVAIGSAAALHILDDGAVFLAALAGGFVLTAVILLRAPALRKQLAWAAVTAGFMIVYASFVVSYLNIMLDDGPKASYTTSILRLEDRRNWVDIAAWGGRRWSDGMAVTRSTYRRLHIGQEVCVYVGRGALGIPWYEVGGCDGNNPDNRF